MVRKRCPKCQKIMELTDWKGKWDSMIACWHCQVLIYIPSVHQLTFVEYLSPLAWEYRQLGITIEVMENW